LLFSFLLAEDVCVLVVVDLLFAIVGVASERYCGLVFV